MSKESELPIGQVHADPHQPRQEFDPEKMAILLESVAAKGILVPLVVMKNAQGYVIVDGERRYRVASKLGMETVPVRIIEKLDDTQLMITRFNIHEHQHSWTVYEKALAIAELKSKLHITDIEMAHALGVSQSSVSAHVALVGLSKNSFALASQNRISQDWMVKIAKMAGKIEDRNKREKFQEKLIKKIISQEIDKKSKLLGVSRSFDLDSEKTIKAICADKSIKSLIAMKGAEESHRWVNVRTALFSLGSYTKKFLAVAKRGEKLYEPEGMKEFLTKSVHSLNELIKHL